MWKHIRSACAKCLVLAVLVLSGCGGGGSDTVPIAGLPPAPSAAKLLQVQPITQQTSVWCWAAVIEMVSTYYGRRAFQCQTLSQWIQTDCCSFPGMCLTTASEYQIQQSLGALRITSTLSSSAISWSGFVAEIDGGRPVILLYRGSFAGHVVVAYGYDARKGTMFIHDPYYGSFEVPYAQTFSYNNGQMYWVETLSRLAPI